MTDSIKLPEITAEERRWITNNPNTDYLVDWTNGHIATTAVTIAAPPPQPERKHTEAEVDEWVAAFLKCSTNGEFREEARRILGVSHG